MSSFDFPLPQLSNFTEFLCAEGAILPQEVQKINDQWEVTKSKNAELEGGEELEDETLRKSSVIAIYPGEEEDWIFHRMTQLVTQANDYYHFDLRGFLEPLQLAEYGAGDFFDWHLDFGIGASSNRKLSLSIQLSDSEEYEGGDLEFRINNKVVKAPRAAGTAIIFPSFIMHRVTEITKGHRRSIVGWVSGPPYR